MFVGLLFYIPEQDERKIGKSDFSAPSGSITLEVVTVIVIVIIDAPPDHDPHPSEFIFSSNVVLV